MLQNEAVAEKPVVAGAVDAKETSPPKKIGKAPDKAGPAKADDAAIAAAVEKRSAAAAQALGEVITLLRASPAHRNLFLSDLDWLVYPPLLLGQLRVLRHKGRPVGYASWAFLNEETERLLSQPNFRLKPEHWKSGDRAWARSGPT